MKTILITMGFDGEFIENLGVGRIKAYLDSRHYTSDVIYFSKGEEVEKVIGRIDTKSELYGFSTYDRSILDIVKIADSLKVINKNCKIVLGSKYVTGYFKEILQDPRMKSIDYIILGDGEYSIAELIDCMERGEDLECFISSHPHIASRGSLNGKTPLAIGIRELPLPDRSMISDNNLFHAYICDSHGCCEQCSFCSQGSYYKKWNGRTALDIFQEIKQIHRTANVLFFEFVGGSFEDPGRLGKEKIQTLCELILNDNLKISLKCYLRSNSFNDTESDREHLHTMKQAGFQCVFVGMESGNKEDLKLYNKHSSVEQNKKMVELVADAGIYGGSFGFIMLNPYSTMETVKSNYEFLVDVKSHNMLTYINKIIAYSTTSISKKIAQDGLFIKSDFLSQGLSYRFKNSEIATIARFISSHFFVGDMNQFIVNTDSIPLFINQMSSFIENGGLYISQLNDYLNQYFLLLKQFFCVLYMDYDIGKCEKGFDGFYREIKNLDAKMVSLKRQFMKELILHKIINPIKRSFQKAEVVV